MSDDSGKPGPSLREAMELEKAGLLEQLQRIAARVRDIDQKLAKLAEYEQLAAEFNFGLVAKSGNDQPEAVSKAATTELIPAAPILAPVPVPPVAGITLGELVDTFLTDPRSSHHKLRFKTRDHSGAMHERIKRMKGDLRLSSMSKSDLQDLYKEWSGHGSKPAIGHALMGRLRALLTFGSEILENEDCQRLSGIFRSLHFEAPKKRVERLTAEHAEAICTVARSQSRYSIALAQAIQFGTDFRQRDTIGEWVPIAEPGISVVTNSKKQKWLRGLRWEELDANMILTHVTSARQKIISVDLNTVPMVIRELGYSDRSKLPASGPIIISESTGLPYHADDYRRKWREIANLAGVPPTVRNMDSMRSDGGEEEESELEAEEAT